MPRGVRLCRYRCTLRTVARLISLFGLDSVLPDILRLTKAETPLSYYTLRHVVPLLLTLLRCCYDSLIVFIVRFHKKQMAKANFNFSESSELRVPTIHHTHSNPPYHDHDIRRRTRLHSPTAHHTQSSHQHNLHIMLLRWWVWCQQSQAKEG